MKFFAGLVAVGILAASGAAHAEVAQCKAVALKSVTVESNRDDNHEFNKKLILTLNGECGGKNFAHLDLGDPAFEGILSIALAAKAANRPINLAVNKSKATSLSYQIAYVELE
jgi:hypothetical protein